MGSHSRLRRFTIAVGRRLAPLLRRVGLDPKATYELAYWRSRARREIDLTNQFYLTMFTDDIGLDVDHYRDKKILDVGCGPRGSLEWASEATARVGLDPLAARYREFGTADHGMEYVAGGAEAMPFRAGTFDIITSLNSLDHVDDLNLAVSEIERVLSEGGCFVLVVEVHPRPTIAEPISIPWDLTTSALPGFVVVEERHFELDPKRRGAIAGVRAGRAFDHADTTERSGVLAATLKKLPG